MKTLVALFLSTFATTAAALPTCEAFREGDFWVITAGPAGMPVYAANLGQVQATVDQLVANRECARPAGNSACQVVLEGGQFNIRWSNNSARGAATLITGAARATRESLAVLQNIGICHVHPPTAHCEIESRGLIFVITQDGAETGISFSSLDRANRFQAELARENFCL